MNDPFDDLFGKPLLLEGDDEERYNRMRDAVIRDLQPKDVFEWINARDQVDKLWEEQRYKRASTALINGAVLNAVKFYLNELPKRIFGIHTPTADLALLYFSNNPKERKEVISLLAQYGITIQEIHAKAAQLEGGGIQGFERLVAARESERRRLRKERNARRQDRDPDQTSED